MKNDTPKNNAENQQHTSRFDSMCYLYYLGKYCVYVQINGHE